MEQRELREEAVPQPYFGTSTPAPVEVEGTKELGTLYPFIISGGKNTERYYFRHISNLTAYKLNIKPEYFGDESSYTETFPKRIREVFAKNDGAKIFCVFDWDTIYGNGTKLEKHQTFVDNFREQISNGSVTICPSMPSIEYWFYLHFNDDATFRRNYSHIAGVLAPDLKKCFPNPTVELKKLLKKEEYLKDETWVRNLCADGKLDRAIEHAETNISAAEESGNLDNCSYSYVYKIFKCNPNSR